jgi:hypothetical protein
MYLNLNITASLQAHFSMLALYSHSFSILIPLQRNRDQRHKTLQSVIVNVQIFIVRVYILKNTYQGGKLVTLKNGKQYSREQ